MPGFITHLSFGKESIERSNNIMLENLNSKYPSCVGLGLQGPDIFFYYIPAYFFHNKNIGNRMHNEYVNLFFENLIKSKELFSNNDDLEICDAYIIGFIGHYTLDTFCHPYIYFRTDHLNVVHSKGGMYDFGNHLSLETDIDHVVLWNYKGLLPTSFDYRSAVLPSKRELSVISKLLCEAINTTFSDESFAPKFVSKAIVTFANLNRAMRDPNSKKKSSIRAIEQLFFKCSTISAMIPSDTLIKFDDPCNNNHKKWSNPWNSSLESTESIFDLFQDAEPVYLNRLSLYLNNNVDDLLSDLDDLSYCSGLPLSLNLKI